MKRTSRKPSNLSESLQRRLNAYALAASTAGVGMLALAQSAEGKIIYTPANKILPACSGYPRLCLKLDLNHDQIIDFTFTSVSRYIGSIRSYANVGIKGAFKRKNAVRGTVSYPRHSSTFKRTVAVALNSGVKVGRSGGMFYGAAALYGFNFAAESSWGQWYGFSDSNGYSAYLGLKFYFKGKAHYGWARLFVEWSGPPLTLTGYAYETIPNKPIITGKTNGSDVITIQSASLGHLGRL